MRSVLLECSVTLSFTSTTQAEPINKSWQGTGSPASWGSPPKLQSGSWPAPSLGLTMCEGRPQEERKEKEEREDD
ncbi:hypothetical protein E2C01_004524 [Portunus trituberculatus]|uniref:Uncharacterized protein n=1 Tax=Portunus trituberculatus TaxID=210409 RepID=A0A5B7CQR4_PORTR|nr:hypothetical protein [Portunus trituberculatus]